MTLAVEPEIAHGGPLQERLAPAAQREALLADLPGLPRIDIDARRLNDLELFANGGFERGTANWR